MAAPDPSELDANQCIQGSYDDANGRLRVDAVVTATIADVIIHASESSIAIADQTTGNLLTVNPDGTIDVNTIIEATSDNIQIRDPNNGNNLKINSDGSINVVSTSSGTSDINIIEILGTAPSSTNSLPVQLTDGSVFIDPRQIRPLVNTDIVTVEQGTSPWTVNGTVTANIGTTNGLALDATLSAPQGSISGGTPGTKSELAGGIFNATPLTLTDGQQAALQIDSSGNLKTTATVTIPGTVSVTQGTTPWIDNITQFGSNPVVTGTGISGLGIPRVTVSNDSNILATQSGTWNINDITGTVSLPTGASTATKQDTGNISLASIDSKIPSGLTVTSSRLLVDGSGVTQPISAVSLPLPANASTATNQATEIASLSSIDSKLNTLGQKTSAASVPVVIASDQSPIAVTGTITTSPNVNVHDGTGTSITSTGIGPKTGLDVSNLTPVNQGSASLPSDAWYMRITDGSTTAGITAFSLNVNVTNTAVPVSGTLNISNFPTTVNTNYGTVGASTIRTASQIGNATGAAAFGAGLTSAQTIRVVLPTDQTSIPVTQSTSPWVISGTVTANAGTNLNTSLLALESGGNLASIKTNTDNLNLTQGSTTSGQKGNLSFGAVTTAAPTYTTGQSNALSLTTSGALRTDSSGSTQPISGTVAATQSGTWTTGRTWTLASGTDSISSVQSGTWTVQPGNTANTTAWFVKDNSLGTVAAGTAGTQSSLAGGVFNTALPTLTNGQQASLQLDASGRLLTTATAVLSNDTNYGTVGANTLRTAAQIGNSTGAANFGSGSTSAQTLRVVVATDQTVIPVGGNVASAATDSGNPVKVGGVFTTTVPSLTSGQRVDLQTDKTGSVFVNTSGRQRTYSAAVTNLTVGLLATDIFTITGAASTITRIKSIRFAGEATANAIEELLLIKRSTANSGGTSTTITGVAHDSTDAAASSTIRAYTANPTTLGNTVGTVRSTKVQLSGANTVAPQLVEFNFSIDGCKPIVLSSASEVLAVNFNGQTAAGNTLSIDIEWVEE